MSRRVVTPVMVVVGVIAGGTVLARFLGYKHWSLVVPVRDADLTEGERRFAQAHHDLPIP